MPHPVTQHDLRKTQAIKMSKIEPAAGPPGRHFWSEDSSPLPMGQVRTLLRLSPVRPYANVYSRDLLCQDYEGTGWVTVLS